MHKCADSLICDALGISIHTGWYVDSTQESETQGLAAVPARAGQPQAGLIASVLWGVLTPLHTNRFVCSARIRNSTASTSMRESERKD
jgi:hypothetical protein